MKKEYLNEIWKPIKGYEGLYEVSNFGRIKSLNYNRTGKGKILKQKQCMNGYKSVTLYKDGKRKIILVHRLVAQAFLEIPEELRHLEGTRYLQVNHKDENPQNNIVTNLEWCDAKYNVRYGTGIERRSKKRSKPVLQYDLNGNFIKEWKSTMECGRNGFCSQHVASCCRGERKTHKGYIWKYK